MSERVPRPRTTPRVRAEVDLDALRANVRSLRARISGAALMAVVKADGYGHGAVPCARAAKEAGAEWLGTATPEEALALRAAGLPGRILCWLWAPGGPWREAIAADVDVSVSASWSLREVTDAARAEGRPARVHLKADTGLGRNGCQPADWPDLVADALAAERDGLVEVVGLWSHFACADEPDHPATDAQLARFREMAGYAEAQGVRPEVRH
ncbi:alanine racemase, partial [Streptomyces sp. CO7]